MKSAEKIKPENALDVKQLFNYLNYDPNTGVFTWKVNTARSGTISEIAGNVNCRGYRSIWINGLQFKAHRLAWAMSYGEWPDLDIDHINQNKSDNRICNLRHASRSENMFNRGKNKNNKSGIKGVHFCKCTGMWRAQMILNFKHVNIGRFKTKEEAAEAYLKKAKEHRGEFAAC
jgi:hypothetical protein